VPKLALNDLRIMSLKAPEQGQCDVWDAGFKGGSFGVRISQGGAKTFILKHGNRRHTIGRYPILKLAEARTEARRMLAEFTRAIPSDGRRRQSTPCQRFLIIEPKQRRLDDYGHPAGYYHQRK
jgi:hypothetical protein